MMGPKRTCKKCGHGCHCYASTCQECRNEVCGTCDCVDDNEPLQRDSDAKDWSGYLK